MWVVIFKARINHLDAQYEEWAERLRLRALQQYGCLEFYSLQQDDEELAISYWPDDTHIKAWKQEALHQEAQQLGRSRWYRELSVTVAQVQRHYTRKGENHD